MKRDDSVYLRHILDAIERIEGYLTDLTVERFLQDGLLQDAVVRRLEIIGEASHNLSDATRRAYQKVSWAEISGLRNRVVHAYFDVNLQIVWEVARDDLPVLKAQVLEILGELDDAQAG